jgi:predicted N-acetyltransferase YhbS
MVPRDDPAAGPVDLGDGLTLRTATDDDVDAIVAICVAAFGESDAPGVLAAVEEAGGPPNWSVVVDRTRAGQPVVSASSLLDHTLEVSGVGLAAGQVEWVATDPDYQRRGLIRAQFERHHARAARRGHLVVLIAGIPYLYRRFGYGYGLDDPTLFVFDAATVGEAAAASGRSVRLATEADIAALLDLESQRPVDAVRMQRPERVWRRFLAAQRDERSAWEQLLVATDGDRVTGWVHTKREGGGEVPVRIYVEPGVSADAASTDALLGRAFDDAGSNALVIGFDAPGTRHGARLAELGRSVPPMPGYYTRTPDPVGLLRALQPVLSARLGASEHDADRDGTLDVSLYNSGVAIDHEHGEVTEIRAVPGIEDPLEQFGVGVAPDWFGALVLGRWGASGLAERADDVLLGRHARLMDVLFPRLDSDVTSDL